MNPCMEIQEDDNLVGLEIDDVIKLLMIVKGVERRKKMIMPDDGDKVDDKEYTFYKLEYQKKDMAEEDDGIEEDELKTAVKGAVNNAKKESV